MSDYLDTLDPIKVAKAVDDLRDKHPEVIEQYNGNVRFALYMRMVDRQMYRLVGLSALDLADYSWYDAFEGEMPPREAAVECLENDDTYGAFMSVRFGEDE